MDRTPPASLDLAAQQLLDAIESGYYTKKALNRRQDAVAMRAKQIRRMLKAPHGFDWPADASTNGSASRRSGDRPPRAPGGPPGAHVRPLRVR